MFPIVVLWIFLSLRYGADLRRSRLVVSWILWVFWDFHVVLLFLSLRYGADLCRSRLVIHMFCMLSVKDLIRKAYSSFCIFLNPEKMYSQMRNMNWNQNYHDTKLTTECEYFEEMKYWKIIKWKEYKNKY